MTTTCKNDERESIYLLSSLGKSYSCFSLIFVAWTFLDDDTWSVRMTIPPPPQGVGCVRLSSERKMVSLGRVAASQLHALWTMVFNDPHHQPISER